MSRTSLACFLNLSTTTNIFFICGGSSEAVDSFDDTEDESESLNTVALDRRDEEDDDDDADIVNELGTRRRFVGMPWPEPGLPFADGEPLRLGFMGDVDREAGVAAISRALNTLLTPSRFSEVLLNGRAREAGFEVVGARVSCTGEDLTRDLSRSRLETGDASIFLLGCRSETADDTELRDRGGLPCGVVDLFLTTSLFERERTGDGGYFAYGSASNADLFNLLRCVFTSCRPP
jgi:hypothetical protein